MFRAKISILIVFSYALSYNFSGHETGVAATAKEPLDHRVVEHLKAHIRSGVISRKQLTVIAQRFVCDIIFNGSVPPNANRKRFYPDRKMIKADKRELKLFQTISKLSMCRYYLD